MNHYVKIGLAACCAVAMVTVANAQHRPKPPTPVQRAARAVYVRQAVMTVQQFSLGPVFGMLRGAPFDAKTAQTAAMRLVATTGMIAAAFRTDTSKFDVKTLAKPNVWTDKAGFDMQIRDLQQAVSKMQQAAMSGDKTATLDALKGVGKSCGSCHNKFRKKLPRG
ncbi:MAG: c-type cytochrome [Steroidobacteraceae bacterium]